MKNIVITGSSRGIGFALAEQFLRRDCRVVISGHSQASTDRALEILKTAFPTGEFFGFPCDVREYNQLQNLWDESVKVLGTVDIWINNAGISNEQNPPWEIPTDEIKDVLTTNLIGEIYGTKVAMLGFLEQGFGALYNVEGYGANGKMNNVMGLSIYGTSKAGLHFFNQCLAKEAESTNIITGALQPGMVLTDLITQRYIDKPEEWERVKRIFNVIAAPLDEVTAWLAEKILTNTKNGAYLKYGNYFRILKRLLSPSKND